MKVVIEVPDEMIEECEVGDEKAITLTVTSNDGTTIEGEGTHVEHITGEEEYEDEEYEAPKKSGKRGVPRAVMIVAEKE